MSTMSSNIFYTLADIQIQFILLETFISNLSQAGLKEKAGESVKEWKLETFFCFFFLFDGTREYSTGNLWTIFYY